MGLGCFKIFVRNINHTEAYLGLCQVTMIEHFARIIMSLTVFTKSFIINYLKDPYYNSASDLYKSQKRI